MRKRERIRLLLEHLMVLYCLFFRGLMKARPDKRQRTRIADDVEIEEIEIDDGIYAGGEGDDEVENDSDIEATQRETEQLHERIRNRELHGSVAFV
jgi:hypothetical protein